MRATLRSTASRSTVAKGVGSSRMLMAVRAVSPADVSRCQTPATKVQQPGAPRRNPCSASRTPGRSGHVPVSDTCNRTVTAGRSRQEAQGVERRAFGEELEADGALVAGGFERGDERGEVDVAAARGASARAVGV